MYSFILPNSRIRVNLLDTPGFDDTVRDDFTVLGEVAGYLDTIYRKGILLQGVIYLHNINEKRIRGSNVANFDMFRELCGKDFQSRVIILTTMWDKITKEDGTQCETNLLQNYLGSMINDGSQIKRFARNLGHAEALKIISSLVYGYNKGAPVQIQEELYRGLGLNQTGAAQVLHKDLLRQEQLWIQKLHALDQENKAAIARNDARIQGRLKVQRQKALHEQTKVQDRLENVEADNYHLRDQVEELIDDGSKKRDEIQSLINRITLFRRAWEQDHIRSPEELRKSRKVQSVFNWLKDNGNGKIFSFAGDLFKIGVTAFFSDYFK